DLHEARREVAIDEPRQPRPHAEGRQIDADDQRELRDRVADDVARHGAGEKLVDQPAGRDDENVEKKERGPIHHPWIVEAMMIARPSMTEPMRIARATFWSSSTSLRIENGVTRTMIQN